MPEIICCGRFSLKTLSSPPSSVLRNIDLRPTSLEIASFRQQNAGFDHISLAKKNVNLVKKKRNNFSESMFEGKVK